MLSKFHEVTSLQEKLLFVLIAYSRPTQCTWEDDDGDRHPLHQHEGGEQGDFDASYLQFGDHNALGVVRDQMEEGEHLFACLDDVYVITSPCRIRELYDLVSRILEGRQLNTVLERRAGNTEKTRIWNRGGIILQNIEQLGPDRTFGVYLESQYWGLQWGMKHSVRISL